MKNIRLTLLIFFFLLFPAFVVSASEDVSIFIDKKEYTFSPSPVMREGHLMIPMRSFFEEMGTIVEYLNENRVALAYRENVEIEITDEKTLPYVNGEKISLDTPAKIIDGNIYVPIRLAAKSLGFNVGWDEEQYAVIMTESNENGAGFLGVDEKTAEKEINEENRVGTSNFSEGTGSFIWPVEGGQITSPYGWRNGRFHSGIDIGASTGTSILASDNGVVVFEGWDGAYGRSIVIKHGKYYTRYAHNSANLVSAGDTVSKGQEIARMGATGRATGPHLHFEIRTDGVYGSTINPTIYVSR